MKIKHFVIFKSGVTIWNKAGKKQYFLFKELTTKNKQRITREKLRCLQIRRKEYTTATST